ncbi:hypothetical protein HanRHA438_Chr15g0702791 [Helianthus annuus]|nr:hypothetical protein HanIR_Chr15g0750201 [Helianthus annuus]KAJ0844465.1 hypothetical protein HanRHA438_Chr15g0702791 [Helianthus annuus]
MKIIESYLKSCFPLFSFELNPLNGLSINRLVHINWYQSGLDPLMDAQEWNESLDRIISTIAEMIDLLKNESRRWATSPIFSTPLPSPVTASPPPTSAPVPTLPPPVSGTAPNVPSPASAATPPASPPKIAPTPCTPVPSLRMFASLPLVPILEKKKKCFLSAFVSISNTVKEWSLETHGIIQQPWEDIISKWKIKVDFMSWFLVDFICVPNEHTNEWRLPWCLVSTPQIATMRTEWRPPWPITERSLIASLRTRIFQAAGNDVCHETHEVMKTYQTYASHREYYHAILVT